MGKDPSVLPSLTYVKPAPVHYCDTLYAEVVEKVYRSKPNVKPTKVDNDLGDDKWRFETLPAAVRTRSTSKQGTKTSIRTGISKDELERLVRWKITHGVNRPFLPGLVRKNDADLVQTLTSEAHQKTLDSKNGKSLAPEDIMSALQTLCKLHGVGPATGALILSIFDPQEIPFFQDELAGWILETAARGERKLKYDYKEYAQLLDGVGKLRKKLNSQSTSSETSITCVMLEKTAYVLRHKDLLDEEKRKLIHYHLLEDEDDDASIDKKLSKPKHDLDSPNTIVKSVPVKDEDEKSTKDHKSDGTKDVSSMTKRPEKKKTNARKQQDDEDSRSTPKENDFNVVRRSKRLKS